MKILSFLFSLLITLGLVYFLSNPLTLTQKDKGIKDREKKETTLPPLGPFLSPFTGFWQNAEAVGVPQLQSFTIPDRMGKVTIHFDERMVPHIFAQNMEDALFAQGYVEASMRLWQMDLLTRLSSGRLSEIMGKDLLKTDQLMRRRGMLYGAKNSEKAWKNSTESSRLLGAYERGINTWIEQLQPKDYPIEFKLLNYKPERWSILKTALVRQYMNLTLNLREEDVAATNALTVYGEENFKKLFPDKDPKQQPIIPPGTEWGFEPVKSAGSPPEEAVGLIKNHLQKTSNELVGSNNWAVSGSKTVSGKPILCNDPHLQLSLPSIWFEVQLHIPETNVYGVTIPGIPGVIIGFNEHVAWGVTNVGTDVADWYKIDWTNEEKTTYLLDGQEQEASIILEPYRVRGMDSLVYDTVKWTNWGPVVYESQGKSDWKDLALRWLSHDEPNPDDLLAFAGLNLSKDLNDYRAALKTYTFPAQNFVFADNQGDIAITVNGRFPLKKVGQGPFVQNGNSTQNGWGGFIPMEHVPFVKNPPRGFVGSANQRSTDDTYPYYYNSAGFDHYRGRVMFDALSRMDSIEVQDMMALQLFDYSIHAAEGLTAMFKNVKQNELTDRELRVLEKLTQWDFSFEKDGVEPVLFQVWWNNYYQLVFDEIMMFEDSLDMLKPEYWRLIEMSEKMPTDAFFDIRKTPVVETAKEVATLSFKATCQELADSLLNPSFNWSGYKKTSIMHLTKIPAFSRMNLDVGGYRHALNAISETHGPSWRMVVELGDEVKGWGVFPGGQSGNPGSKYYDLDVDTWRTGKYNPLFFMKDSYDVSRPVSHTIEIN